MNKKTYSVLPRQVCGSTRTSSSYTEAPSLIIWLHILSSKHTLLAYEYVSFMHLFAIINVVSTHRDVVVCPQLLDGGVQRREQPPHSMWPHIQDSTPSSATTTLTVGSDRAVLSPGGVPETHKP